MKRDLKPKSNFFGLTMAVIWLMALPCQALKNPPILSQGLPSPDICEAVKVQTPNLMGEIIQTESIEICHDKDFKVAVSKNCVKDDCELLRLTKLQKEPLTYSPRGTPGSWLCRKLGGKSSMTFMKSSSEKRQSSPSDIGTKIHICKKDSGLASDDYLVSKLSIKK